MSADARLRLLLGLFVALLVIMNVLGAKLTTFFGVVVSVAIFMVPAMFLITDIVAEVHGRAVAREFVYIGTLCLALLLGLAWIAIRLEPAARFPHEREFGVVFSSSLRFAAASIVAFFLSQLHDVAAFEFWRRRTGGRHLWLRNNASTIVSQAVDTLVFMTIAFYRVSPEYTFVFTLELALPYYLFKIAFAVLDTPLVYAGARWLRNGTPPGNPIAPGMTP